MEKVVTTNGMTVEEVEVTPALAGEWLTKNQHNRFPNEGRVRRYSRDMEAGEWLFTHQPIAFDTQDEILDGQQRLLAILRSNTTQNFLIVRGASRETFYVVDTGKPRNLGDAMQIKGEENARRLASGVNLNWRITGGRDALGWPAPNNPSTPRALDHFDNYTGGPSLFREGVKAGGHVYAYLRGPASAYCGIYPVLANLDTADADWFYDHLATGHIGEETHPVLILRNSLIQHVRDVPVTYDRIFLTALILKAWNYYRDGREIQQLQYKAGGASPKHYPVPH